MACDITLGRLEGCKDSNGGLNAVYFLNFGDAEGWVVTDETITGVAAGTPPSIFKYDLRGTSTFDQSLTTSRDNGTAFAEQTLVLSLKKQDATTQKQIKMLAYGRPHILVEDNNGSVFVVGEDFGSELSASTSTGASMGEKSGYELTFVATEKMLSKFYTGVLATDFAITVGV